MLLKSVKIDHFKHVLDSTEVAIQSDITCLVGKNESGKTAFLEALRRLKPAQGGVNFSIGKHYPAWLEKMHKRQGKNLEHSRPIQTVFELDDDDMAAVSDVFGEGVLTSRNFRVSRRYDNLYSHGFEADEAVAVANAVARMLETVPTKAGTGSRARVANYRVAGKTGTSHKASASGYAAARYVSSFAGFGPASNPRLACVVVINDPTGDEYYGGLVAAPLFSEVMTGAMRILNIPPDDYPTMLVDSANVTSTEGQ